MLPEGLNDGFVEDVLRGCGKWVSPCPNSDA